MKTNKQIYPGQKELLAVGTKAGLKKKQCENMIEKVNKYVDTMLK